MAESNPNPNEARDAEDENQGSPGGTSSNAGPERDFGDSAGYGSGGSALDYREVVGDPDPADRKPNPLDAVMRGGDAGKPTGIKTSGIALAGIGLLAVPLCVYALLRAGPYRLVRKDSGQSEKDDTSGEKPTKRRTTRE